MSNNMDDKLIKKAHKKHKYSEKEILQLSKCADKEEGPLFFMENFMYVQHATRGKIKFDPYPYQRELIKCYHENRYAIALISRQMGKCLYQLSTIKVRNKNTGDEIETNFKDFYEMLKEQKDA